MYIEKQMFQVHNTNKEIYYSRNQRKINASNNDNIYIIHAYYKHQE